MAPTDTSLCGVTFSDSGDSLIIRQIKSHLSIRKCHTPGYSLYQNLQLRRPSTVGAGSPVLNRPVNLLKPDVKGLDKYLHPSKGGDLVSLKQSTGTQYVPPVKPKTRENQTEESFLQDMHLKRETQADFGVQFNAPGVDAAVQSDLVAVREVEVELGVDQETQTKPSREKNLQLSIVIYFYWTGQSRPMFQTDFFCAVARD